MKLRDVTMKLRARIIVIVMVLLGGALSAPVQAQTAPEFSAVFTARQDGYHTYRIPAIVVTTNGTVLAFCEGRKNNGGDSGDIDTLLKRSTDGGTTWGAQQLIWSDDENTCGNPTPVVDRTTGTIWLLMCWNNGSAREKQISAKAVRDGRRVFICHSTDDGVTWTKPEEITSAVKKPGWGWYATGPVNGIQLTRGEHAGRLVIPANHSETGVKEDATNTVSRSHVIYSDDHGQSWHIGGVEDKKTNESTVAELLDGAVMQNMRSYHNRNQRVVATSPDGGLSWSPVHFDETLVEPVCQGSLFRYSWPGGSDKSRLLFSNPASLKREKLTVRLSYDEGSTWAFSRLLQDGPSAYSCLTRLPDNSIGCLFECGKKNPYETITLARIPLSWLEEAKTAQ
jgi:sialidase-1